MASRITSPISSHSLTFRLTDGGSGAVTLTIRCRGGVSLMRTGLQMPLVRVRQAANWRHSAKATERFSRNSDRGIKCRSRLK